MKGDVFKARQIILKDKMMDVSGLSELINNEVCNSLSNYISISSCNTKVRVGENPGRLEIVISLFSDGIKSQKTL